MEKKFGVGDADISVRLKNRLKSCLENHKDTPNRILELLGVSAELSGEELQKFDIRKFKILFDNNEQHYLLRLPNFGRKSLNELREYLSNSIQEIEPVKEEIPMAKFGDANPMFANYHITPQRTLFDDVAIAALQGMLSNEHITKIDLDGVLAKCVESAFRTAKTYMEMRDKYVGEK